MHASAFPFVGKKLRFRLVSLEDAELIFTFRQDERRNKYLSPTAGDVEAQKQWLRSYKQREAAGSEIYFVIEQSDGESLGCARMYEIGSDSFTCGSWIMKPGAPATAAIESIILFYDLVFRRLGFANAHFEVRKENVRVAAFHERFGAQRVRDDDVNNYYVLPAATYEAVRDRYRKYLP